MEPEGFRCCVPPFQLIVSDGTSLRPEGEKSKGDQGAEVGDLIENETGAIARKQKEIDRLWDKASELAFRQGDFIRESREKLEEAGGTQEMAVDKAREEDDDASMADFKDTEKADTQKSDTEKS